MRAFVRFGARGLVVTLGAALLVPLTTAPGAPSVAVSAAAAARAEPGALAVASGGEHSCEVRADHTMWCWGRNSYGQLGQGTTGDESAKPVRVGTGDKWGTVAAGAAFNCAIKITGKLYCWGVNHRGQLGDKSNQVRPKPERVGQEATWAQVALGQFHVCATRTNGSLWCWGDNSAGELGDGTHASRSKPTRVKGREWASVAAGGWHTCATKTDGSLWCWGRNLFGQLGTSNYMDHAKPVRIGTSVGWRDLAASFTHTCGARQSGQVLCWGRNTTGQLGSATAGSPTPLTVPGVTGATAVAVTEGTSCALLGGGALKCWGANNYGQLGEGVAGYGPSTRVGSYRLVSGGWLHLCAVAIAGATQCWGNNEWGQLGNGTTSPRLLRGSTTSATKGAGAVRSGGAYEFGLATFNVLGNHHTWPYADADRFASSRIRAEWSYQAIKAMRADVVALQESTEGQLSAILRASQGDLAAFPDPSADAGHIESSLVWDTDVFEAVKKRTLKTQFIRRVLPRPLVKFRHLATGQMIWVLGVHNAGWDQQRERDQATKVQIAKVQELEQGTAPVFYLGDMNEKKTILCKVLKKTELVSPAGGRRVGGNCQTPTHMRVDWIFGPKTVTWSGFVNSRPPLVSVSTDHTVPVVRVHVPAA